MDGRSGRTVDGRPSLLDEKARPAEFINETADRPTALAAPGGASSLAKGCVAVAVAQGAHDGEILAKGDEDWRTAQAAALAVHGHVDVLAPGPHNLLQ